MRYIGDFAEDHAAIPIHFTTHTSTGALVAPSSAFTTSDVSIYKNGSATQKTSANGLTMTSPFDSIVGRHLLMIDTSNDTGDAGFWVSGADYRVEINSAKTVNSIVQTGVVLATFSVENRSATTAKIQAAAAAAITAASPIAATLPTATQTSIDNIEADTNELQSDDYPTRFTTIDSNLTTIDTVVDGIQTDLDNGIDGLGALKVLIDAVKAVADTIQVFTDASTPQTSDHTSILTTIAGYIDTEIADIKAKTDNIPSDPATETTLAILDSLVDAIKGKTDQLTFTVANQVDANALTGGGDNAATTYTYFTSGSNEDVFKADVSLLATQVSVDVIDGIVDNILIGTDELQTNQGNWTTATGFATPTNVTDAQAAIIAEIDANETKIDAIGGGLAGAGAITHTLTILDSGSLPIANVEVWISTDLAGTNVVAGTLITDAFGEVIFYLDAGTYYVWRNKPGVTFTTNPVQTTVV